MKPKLSWMWVDTSCQDNYHSEASVLGQEKRQKLCGAKGILIWKLWCGNILKGFNTLSLFKWKHLQSSEGTEMTMLSVCPFTMGWFVTSPLLTSNLLVELLHELFLRCLSPNKLDLQTRLACRWWHLDWPKTTVASL